MVQGTGSHVGKSVVTAALCRIFAQDGYRVAPFKSQNMALNSFVTKEGGEMGRAQVVQAEACGVQPHVDMNPVLLKPTSDHRSQVIVEGRPIGTMTWKEYDNLKPDIFRRAMAAFWRLAARSDIVVIEGAGSPAEVNLKSGDIVNMRVALEVDAPVLLVTDIDRGGALAWVVGTLELLEKEEREQVKGIIINKFRGSFELLEPAVRFLEERTGVPVVGVLPYITDIEIPEEDSLGFGAKTRLAGEGMDNVLDVAVVKIPRASNFTDVDALLSEPDVSLRYLGPRDQVGKPDLLIIPGSKNTIEDLMALKQSGLAQQIREYAQSGGCILGICGGYQMLGLVLEDPEHIETSIDCIEGLGLLPVRTVMQPEKLTVQVSGTARLPDSDEIPIRGYEIHCGQTVREGGQPWVFIERDGEGSKVQDGCVTQVTGQETPEMGWVFGTYVHGILDSPRFRRSFLNYLRRRRGWQSIETIQPVSRPYEKLADAMRPHLDMGRIYELLQLEQS